ncbi:MAG: glycosyltransferase family 2 protein [Actinobacteria bacterium]|nr:glycosyltransferase family 2 protein [Actinomycetota bacterium]
MLQLPSMRVQVILYSQPEDVVESCIESISVSLGNARSKRLIAGSSIILGDCSGSPCLANATVERMKEDATAAGIDHLEYTHFGRNLGFGGGHNRLVEGAHEDLLLILNPDTYSSPLLVEEMVSACQDASVGIVDAKQLPLEHPKSYDPVTMDTSWALGACMMIRTSVMTGIGGFDDKSFFLYCEDVDLSWRARLHGWRVVHQPHAKIFHDKHLTGDGMFVPAETEPENSAESSLVLAYKYSRDDIVDKMVDAFLHSPAHFHRKAVNRFNQRRLSGDLPARIDQDHSVGQFVGFDFAEHNFSYAD